MNGISIWHRLQRIKKGAEETAQMTLSKYSPVQTWRLFPNIFLFHFTLFCPVILPNTMNELLKNKQNTYLLLDTQSSLNWKGFHLLLEEAIQTAVTRTFAHLQHPSCYRLSCEMQLNLQLLKFADLGWEMLGDAFWWGVKNFCFVFCWKYWELWLVFFLTHSVFITFKPTNEWTGRRIG